MDQGKKIKILDGHIDKIIDIESFVRSEQYKENSFYQTYENIRKDLIQNLKLPIIKDEYSKISLLDYLYDLFIRSLITSLSCSLLSEYPLEELFELDNYIKWPSIYKKGRKKDYFSNKTQGSNYISLGTLGNLHFVLALEIIDQMILCFPKFKKNVENSKKNGSSSGIHYYKILSSILNNYINYVPDISRLYGIKIDKGYREESIISPPRIIAKSNRNDTDLYDLIYRKHRYFKEVIRKIGIELIVFDINKNYPYIIPYKIFSKDKRDIQGIFIPFTMRARKFLIESCKGYIYNESRVLYNKKFCENLFNDQIIKIFTIKDIRQLLIENLDYRKYVYQNNNYEETRNRIYKINCRKK